MTPTERRQRLRRILTGDKCIRPACVWDPVSARIAQSLGFETGQISGSVVSAVTVGAPDLAVMTLTELAGTAHLVTKASDLSLVVDADHGYGNALSVMRTVRELEDVGVAGLTIEDTLLPRPFGRAEKGQALIAVDEIRGKLRAALAARRDTTTVIIGRTSALQIAGQEELLVRLRAFVESGVDAVYLMGITTLDQLRAVQHVVGRMPILLGTTPETLSYDAMGKHGVRLAIRGAVPFDAAARAIYDTLKHEAQGGEPSTIRDRLMSREMREIATGAAEYNRWADDYLSPPALSDNAPAAG